ncbi:hypothetical protein ES708_25443 [subsurface metagenome]
MREYIDEIIALILVVGCLLLIGFGIDGEVKSILVGAGGWVFGREYVKRIRDRKKAE